MWANNQLYNVHPNVYSETIPNGLYSIQVHEHILNFVPGIDLFSKENDNEQGKGDQNLDMGDIWLVEEK